MVASVVTHYQEPGLPADVDRRFDDPLEPPSILSRRNLRLPYPGQVFGGPFHSKGEDDCPSRYADRAACNARQNFNSSA